MFEFKHIKAFDRAYADNPGPMVGTQGPHNFALTIGFRYIASRWERVA